MEVLCPITGKRGKRVSLITVRSLVRPDYVAGIEDREWYFCEVPDCDIAYFAENGQTLRKDALRVRVGLKERQAPRLVCYCFDHTVEGIQEEIERTGRSTVVAAITAKVHAGECHCETMNPKGSCCLGDLAKVAKETFALLKKDPPAPMPGCTPGAPSAHDCCASYQGIPAERHDARLDRAGLFAAGASVLSAIAASACCWLPLLLIALGTSAVGVSAAFEHLRPVFLILAPLLLGTGFYLVYFRKAACTPDGTCTRPNRKVERFSRAVLWISTAVVITVAFFPNYVGVLFGRTSTLAVQAGSGRMQTVTLSIEGMTCEACAIHIQKELAATPGVLTAKVLYAEGRADVLVDASSPPVASLLIEAAGRAGYSARIREEGK